MDAKRNSSFAAKIKKGVRNMRSTFNILFYVNKSKAKNGKTEELKSSTLVACLCKNSATKTATSVLNGVNSLLGGNKVNRLEKENAQLHREVEDLNGQIERLHTDMQKMKDNHARELNRNNKQHQQEVSNLTRILDKVYTAMSNQKPRTIDELSCNCESPI